jgi:FeS assembly SUF system regulator
VRLSNLADYAIVLMQAASGHCGLTQTLVAGRRLNAEALSEETGISLPTVQKLVSRLSRAGLLKAVRGSGGGIQLSRPAAAITVADIVEAVEGPIALTACVDETRHDCALEGSCAVRPHWKPINEAMRGALASVTLASLTRNAMEVPANGTSKRELA